MKKKIWLYSFVALFLGLTSCNDFLEEYSQNQVYVTTVEDLNELLVGECFMSWQNVYSATHTSSPEGQNYPWLHVMDDDSEEFLIGELASDQSSPRNVLAHFHRWQSDPFTTIEDKQWEDQDWSKFYERIAVLNNVIYYAGEFRKDGDDEELLNRVEGEARFLRAGYYFLLVNMYGKPYSKATAYEDAGVPLKILEAIEDIYFTRASVGDVYDQIVDDLERAAKCLEGIVPTSTIRVGPAAANALLSRVYLYMERYEEAIAAADLVLDESYGVLDLNNWEPGQNALSHTSVETIFEQGGCAIPSLFINDSTGQWQDFQKRGASAFQVSDDLLNCYEPGDLRREAFFRFTTQTRATLPDKYRTWWTKPEYYGSSSSDPEFVGTDFLIRLPEVILNKAEALAMLNRDGEAKTELEKLRSKRFSPADLTPVTETGEALVNFIRDERRRELCFEGHRWFDLRRYSVNSIYPLDADFTIRHTNYTYNASTNNWLRDGYYELGSYQTDEAAWIVPIPNYAIEFNQGSLTNEIRPERELKRD